MCAAILSFLNSRSEQEGAQASIVARFIASWKEVLLELRDEFEAEEVLMVSAEADACRVLQKTASGGAAEPDLVTLTAWHQQVANGADTWDSGQARMTGVPLKIGGGGVVGSVLVSGAQSLTDSGRNKLEKAGRVLERDLGLVVDMSLALLECEELAENTGRELADLEEKYQAEIGELVRTKKDLERSEANYSSLVQNIPGIVYHCALDSDWTMHLISDDVEKVTGYPASDFIQNRVRTYADSIYEEDRQYVEDRVMHGVENGETYTIEYRILHKDESIRWVYEQGKAITGEDGELLWLDGVILDITEKKAAEFELQRSEERGKMLKEVAISANAAPKVSAVLQSALDSICHYAGWPVGHVYLINQEKSALVSSSLWHIDDSERHGGLKEVAPNYSYGKGEGVPGLIWQSGQAYWCENTQKDPVCLSDRLGEGTAILSTFGFPIRADGKVIAVLEFFSDKQLDRDEDLLRVVEKIGEQLEIVLQRKYGELRLLEYQESLESVVRQRTMELESANQHLAASLESLEQQREVMDADLEMAKQLQTSFLPEVFPFSESVRFGGFYNACDTIGGDLYGAFPLTDDVVGMYMADVSGHGVSAAMVTAVLKVSIDRALQHLQGFGVEDAEVGYAAFMHELNAEMFKITHEDKFITFQLMLLNVQNGQLRILNAGHTRPIHFQKNKGQARAIQLPSNVPVGLLKDAEFEVYSEIVSEGDKILMYTDGLTERTNAAGEEFGESRLLERVTEWGGLQPKELCSTIMKENETFRGGVGDLDDIALLAAEFSKQRVAATVS